MRRRSFLKIVGLGLLAPVPIIKTLIPAAKPELDIRVNECFYSERPTEFLVASSGIVMTMIAGESLSLGDLVAASPAGKAVKAKVNGQKVIGYISNFKYSKDMVDVSL